MSDAASPHDRLPVPDADTVTIAHAARRAVDRWLKKTARLVRDAARRSLQDAEEIHRLRVAIRHTDAALITFQSLLPHKKCRRLRKRLRRLRRKAGEIRDIDVLLDRISSLSAGDDDPGADLRENRRKLAYELRSRARDELDDRLQRRIRRIIKCTRWRGPDPAPQLSAVASRLLAPIAAGALAAGARDLSDLPRLHRFRVCVKRLRYAVEFLETGLPHVPAARLQAELSGLQQRLGEVCDHAAAVQLLAAERESQRCAASTPALDELIAREHKLLATRKSEFVGWWCSTGRAELDQSIGPCLA